MGATGEDVEGGLDMAKRHHVVVSQREQLEEKPVSVRS